MNNMNIRTEQAMAILHCILYFSGMSTHNVFTVEGPSKTIEELLGHTVYFNRHFIHQYRCFAEDGYEK